MQEHKCSACHARKVGGDGSAIYRPKGRINSPGALRGMVELCNTELNLQLFPEDVTAVAAVLQRDHYRFERGGRSGQALTLPAITASASLSAHIRMQSARGEHMAQPPDDSDDACSSTRRPSCSGCCPRRSG